MVTCMVIMYAIHMYQSLDRFSKVRHSTVVVGKGCKPAFVKGLYMLC